jgi:shikimate dehydrogenase
MWTGRLFVFDRRPEQARALVHDLARLHGSERVTWIDDLEGPMAEATGLVHATPTGMASHPGLPLPERLLRPACWVAEIVYFPLQTDLLAAARRAGCATVDGGTMAVGQAIGAFELFTGLRADAQRMSEHFGRLLGGH